MSNETEFFNWFAGLIDGEGHFSIVDYQHSNSFATRLIVEMRADDLELLEMIRERLQMGNISIRCRTDRRKDEHPHAIWQVTSKSECQEIVKIFDQSPLRSRKQKDYEVWREAVMENCKHHSARDINKLKYLFLAIKAVRQFNVEEVNIPSPQSLQMEMDLE